MKVGQYIYLSSTASYGEIYDAPSISSSPVGYTSGYIGLIKKLNVAGVGEKTVFTEIEDTYGDTKYINNADIASFEINDVKPNGDAETPPIPPTPPTTSTLDKITSIFGGLLSIFNKTQKPAVTAPTTGTGQDGTTDGSGTETPTPANAENPTFGTWFAKNWYWSLPLALLIPGGLIWAIVASVKKSKAKTLAMGTNPTTQKPK